MGLNCHIIIVPSEINECTKYIYYCAPGGTTIEDWQYGTTLTAEDRATSSAPADEYYMMGYIILFKINYDMDEGLKERQQQYT